MSKKVFGGRAPLHFGYLASSPVPLSDHCNEMGHINIGAGDDMMIAELAGLIDQDRDFGKKLVFETSKPYRILRKPLDSNRFQAFEWSLCARLSDGLDHKHAAARGGF